MDTIFLVGLIRGLLGLPIEHPFDVVKTHVQSEGCKPRVAIQTIWRSEGIRGFYRGLYANGTTTVLKQTWRQPVYLTLTEKLGDRYGYGAINAMITAPVMAVSESLLLTLPDRLKVRFC